MSLTDLADVIRRAGLPVKEVEGWQLRGRSNNADYRPGLPTHVMVHHTASNTSAINDVTYMTFNAPYSPIANLYVARDGVVWVMAGRPTNTNGSGQDTWGGGVPVNSMNTHAIGIEIANAGTGQPYPKAQQDSVMTLVRALMKAYRIPVKHVRAHHEWAPNRKIDPFGPSRWGDRKWDMDAFRTEAARVTPPPEEDEEVKPIALIKLPGDNRVWIQWPGYKTWVPDPDTLGFLSWAYGLETQEVNHTVFKAAGPVVGPNPDNRSGFGIPK